MAPADDTARPAPDAPAIPTADLTRIQNAIEGLSGSQRRLLLKWLQHREGIATQACKQARRAARTLRSAVQWTIFSLFAFLAVEAAVFRTGWYNKYVEPNSTAGALEYRLLWLRHTVPTKPLEVLVIGDSRIAEGFSAKVAGSAVERIHFTNFGMPGSAPRVWYYTLRDADPKRTRFSAIVLSLDHYTDDDRTDVAQNRVHDLAYLAGRLRLSDCWSFSRSFDQSDLRNDVLTSCFLRGIAFRPDVLDFLSDISGRIARTRDWRNHGAGYLEEYGGKPEDLTGLTADLKARTISFPAGLKDWQTSSVRDILLPDPAPQTGALTAYRRRWIGGILDLYKGSATRIIFAQIPRGPVPMPNSVVPPRFLNSIGGDSKVTILPPETFGDFERADVFADGLHLNHAGRPLFSERLARRVSGILQGH